MIDEKRVKLLVEEFIKEKALFLVSLKVSSSKRIIVLVDKNEGISIDECAELHRYLEKNLDRNNEDFELQVSSPGLDLPFGVIEQYYKNEGKKVEVTDNDGTRYSGLLKNVTEGGFELETEIKIKGKAREKRDISFNFDQVKTTRVILTI